MNKGVKQLFVMVAGAFISDVDCKESPYLKEWGVGFFAHAPHYKLLRQLVSVTTIATVLVTDGPGHAL